MATSTVEKQVCQIRLNNGVDTQGNTVTIGINLGTLNASAWDADKALAIVDLLEPCLSKTVEKTYGITTSVLEGDD